MARTVLLWNLLLTTSWAKITSSYPANNSMVYSFDDINPRTNLEWTPCYMNFTCARLTVPLDYADPKAGNTSIAYIKLPASTQPAEDILFNPGGPGNSGVGYVLRNSVELLEKIGSSHNLVGFDPRGVNNSGPRLSCFPDAPETEARFASQFRRPINSRSPESMVRTFEIMGAWGDWCSRVHRNGPAKYAGTVATARDLLNYAEKKALADGEEAGRAKLWYWGISYGSALGATYATLFPDRIGRMILDGVVDVGNYYKGNGGGLIQSDEAVLSFAHACQAAGKDKCVLYSPTTDEIAKRMRTVLEDLRNDPVPLSDSAICPLPILLTYEDLVFTLFALLYSPVSSFPLLAGIFADLERRNATSLASMIQAQPPTAVDYGGLISCMDSKHTSGALNVSTMALWEGYVADVNYQTQWVGDAWSSIGLLCRKMDIIQPESQRFQHAAGANKTSFPILFVGNTVDPITPIVGARKMSSLFPGSSLLTQNSVGHTSLAAKSRCTSQSFQKYLRGVLPVRDTTCEVESIPFSTSN